MNHITQRSRVVPRHGIASVWALAVLAVLAVFSVSISGQLFSGRHWLERRETRAQALWLARGGIELAEAKLLANPEKYDGDAPEFLPGWRVRITIQKLKGAEAMYLMTSEAGYPAENPSIRRSLKKTVRCIAGKEGARLETVAPMNGETEL